jgi:hypothetical protein
LPFDFPLLPFLLGARNEDLSRLPFCIVVGHGAEGRCARDEAGVLDLAGTRSAKLGQQRAARITSNTRYPAQQEQSLACSLNRATRR